MWLHFGVKLQKIGFFRSAAFITRQLLLVKNFTFFGPFYIGQIEKMSINHLGLSRKKKQFRDQGT